MGTEEVKDAVAAVMRQQRRTRGCVGVVESCGDDKSLGLGFALLSDGGALSCVGQRLYPSHKRSSSSGHEHDVALPVPCALSRLDERQIRLSFCRGEPRTLLGVALRVAQAAAASLTPLRAAVTEHRSFDDAQEAYEETLADLEVGNVRTLIYPGTRELRDDGAARAMYAGLD